MKSTAFAPDRLDAARAAVRVGGASVRFRAGDVLFRPGDDPKGWIVIERGRVRVGLTADTGREVTLYRLSAGDTCLLTTSALLASISLPAEATAESDVEARFVPTAVFERLLGEDAEFRHAVLRNYAERMAELVMVIQDVLFHGLPERLARLLTSAPGGAELEITHQAIAKEIGSSREVVSRVLARFERDGLIASERGRIKIVDSAGLKRIAAPSVT